MIRRISILTDKEKWLGIVTVSGCPCNCNHLVYAKGSGYIGCMMAKRMMYMDELLIKEEKMSDRLKQVKVVKGICLLKDSLGNYELFTITEKGLDETNRHNTENDGHWQSVKLGNIKLTDEGVKKYFED